MLEAASPLFAQIVVQIGAPNLPQPFTYRIPPGMTLAVGDCVVVPFGPREATGYVVGLADDCDPEVVNKTKDVGARIDGASGFDAALWNIALWISEQTLCDVESALRLIAPEIASARIRTEIRLDIPGADLSGLSEECAKIVASLSSARDHRLVQSDLGRGPETARALAALRKRGVVSRVVRVEPPAVREKTVRLVQLAVDPDVAASEAARLESKASKQAHLLRELAAGAVRTAGASVPDAGRVVDPGMRAAAQALAQKGLVTYHQVAVRRDPFGLRSLGHTYAPPFTDEQASAAKSIGAAIEDRRFESFLLFGVTGSGKTEVYMDAIARARAQDRGAILLVPEISLSAQVMDILKARFGGDVAVLHSALTMGEWFDEWQRIRRGEAMVVVGARSAIFAPLPSVGVIIVDEEHDGAYKQDSLPRYQAREVALYRAREAAAAVILGSATPSIETFYRAQNGEHTLLSLESRVHARPLPPVRTLDLRITSKALDAYGMPPHLRGVISPPLLAAIGDRLQRREQTILFLNRRGFAQFLMCRDCGHSLRCPNCAVSLTFHRNLNLVQCHHCDYRAVAPANCPKCSGLSVRTFGIGTEKVQEAVGAAFPAARALRLDRDTVTKKGAHGEILRAFKRGEADILIGTQMVAKGLDFANVTLVGVINADTALNMPDFRASERSFQLLMQVSGRAGRGLAEGAVMVQTFNPDHESIRLAANHDYRAFYEIEIANRRELIYPPFASLANLVITDADERRVVEQAHAIARKIRDLVGPVSRPQVPSAISRAAERSIDILGPVACPLERLRNRYRWHILLRSADKPALLALLRKLLSALSPIERSSITLDIDPIAML